MIPELITDKEMSEWERKPEDERRVDWVVTNEGRGSRAEAQQWEPIAHASDQACQSHRNNNTEAIHLPTCKERARNESRKDSEAKLIKPSASTTGASVRLAQLAYARLVSHSDVRALLFLPRVGFFWLCTSHCYLSSLKDTQQLLSRCFPSLAYPQLHRVTRLSNEAADALSPFSLMLAYSTASLCGHINSRVPSPLNRRKQVSQITWKEWKENKAIESETKIQRYVPRW